MYIYIYIPVSSSCCIFSAVLEKTWLRSQTAGKSAFEHFSNFSRLEKKCKNETAQIGAKTAQNDAKTAQNSGNHQKRMIFLKTTCFLPNCKNYCSFGKQHFFRAPGWYRYREREREKKMGEHLSYCMFWFSKTLFLFSLGHLNLSFCYLLRVGAKIHKLLHFGV